MRLNVQHGIRLIEVEAIKKPHPAENVLKKAAEAFAKFGITKTPRLPQGEIFAAELEELREFARQRRAQVVSNVYLGSEPHEWKCEVPEHPTWLAEAWRIRKGHWCPSCAGNRPLGLEGLRAWGRNKGLELLDAEYRGIGAIYRWQCSKAAHVVERTKSNIQQSIWRRLPPCTACAGTAKARVRSGPREG